ncbi:MULTISPECIES: type VI secretion system baseplate subunit TssE [unclassified Achromobacter]|uniref:type VI secretion system baseplate subunit TssE n=1 Tax=unclassified Achromobacter TaxID=2626865 RepID=UPI0008B5DB51|nr:MULTISPECIES: type VI secretion system baseplate subunit TssE [unclassified Achromobacter]SEK09479.1 type VI secretion system protein [Achromobacter sp. NFACC18-2]SIT25189.1 type VI secretion system protein [Achromobacter sp. MFA1 R4]
MPRSSGQGSLFERLEPDAPPRRVRSRQDAAAARIRAIKRHLELILNSRRGCSISSPGLGLLDFNDAATGSADLLLRISQDIRQSVAEFEPRVRVLAVHARPDGARPLDLTFRLDCLVPLANAEEQVEIDLIIHRPDRYARIV